MAEDKSPSTKDLFLLIVGLYKLKVPNDDTGSGEQYWLNDEGSPDEGSLRKLDWNWDWFGSPKQAWEKVPYRDWLIATLAANVTGGTHDFSAISEPMLISLDVLTNEFKPDTPGVSDAIKQVLTSKARYQRSIMSTLSLGLSKQKRDNQEVFVFGAGMRRRLCTWAEGVPQERGLQADMEFFVPFCVVPNKNHSEGDSFPGMRSICAGIALTRPNGDPIGHDKDNNEIVAARFNFRIPFTARMTQQIKRDDYQLETVFDPPVIEAQRRIRANSNSETSGWQKMNDWKTFVKDFCELTDGRELLNAPIGPLLLEEISGNSGIKDIILKQSKREEIKEDLKETQKELDQTLEFLEGIWNYKPKDKKTIDPSSGQHRLGMMLEWLGLLEGKSAGGGDFEYKLADLSELTVWDVVNRLLSELDGFPLYVKGVSRKNDKEARFALSLASQVAETNANKHYFGLAGLAYNIPVKTVSEEEAAKEDDPNAAKIVLDKGNFTEDKSILIDPDEDEEEEEEEGTPPIVVEEDKSKEKSTVEIFLHLGKWFGGETLEDNWFRRLLPDVENSKRTPLPGIRILPFQREHKVDNTQANYSLTVRVDLLSIGFDIKGTTKDGLGFLQFNKGPFAYFGLGAFELRTALLLASEHTLFDRPAFAVGIKFKDMRLSFGPKGSGEEKKEEKEKGDDIIEGMQELLADEWEIVPAPKKPEEKEPKTRLSAKKKDKFSISVGYLSPLAEGSHGTLDIQIYDEKGNRGKMAWIPIDRRAGPFYLKHIGIGLKGVENVELSEGLSDDAQLTVALTGGLRFPAFELGLIGAKVTVPLNNPLDLKFGLDGLDISLKLESVVISGSFLKSGIEYAGSLTVELPKFSVGAMGFYGNLREFSMSPNEDDDKKDNAIVKKLRRGEVHDKLRKKLLENKITPAASDAVRRGFSAGQWKLATADGNGYIITEDDGKVNVLSPDRTFFFYATVSAASGHGISIGPIQLTGAAFGYGYNRKVIIPRIEKVAEFPLVQMVMGEGGYQEGASLDEVRNQLGKPVEDPVSVLEKMKDHLPVERGQEFICGGVRFTIARAVDCFALAIVQWGKETEISLLGLARFRHPRDLSAKAICYVEMQILMTIKPKGGTFKLQALLTSNSWIINKDCKLTGGFALFVWFDGPHKDDFVITLGGYHPRFRRPDHYPIVPRLGLNWPVNDNLTIKGGVYLAITPSCGMLGARLEATFHSGRISAWFTAYLDVIVKWSPLHFEAELGISMRVEAAFAVTSIKATISVTLQMWGPPVGGVAQVDLTLISFDVPFGTPRDQAEPELIKTWGQFCRTFLSASGSDKRSINKPVMAFPIVQPNLAAGRNNLNNLPTSRRESAEPARDKDVWKVRGDQLELAASASVPVTTLNVGRVKTNSTTEGIQDPDLKGIQNRDLSGQPLMVPSPVALDNKRLFTAKYKDKLGVHPMGKALESVLNITVVRDDLSGPQAIDISEWTIETETNSLPEALWKAGQPESKPEPSARLMQNCITGIKRMKPPVKDRGPEVILPKLEWKPITKATVAKSGAVQKAPSTTHSRDIQAAVASKQKEQKEIVEALSGAGFNLSWQPSQRFRELLTDPLAGEVAPSA